MFSSRYLASSHLSHRIVIFKVFNSSAKTHKRLQEGHARTPWCLTFDPHVPNLLLSGCLAGVVCRWDVEVRSHPLLSFVLPLASTSYFLPSSQAGTLLGSWQSFFPNPISSIAFLSSSSLSSSSGFVLVTVHNTLCLMSSSRLEVVYESSTVNSDEKIRFCHLFHVYNYI